MLRKNNAHVASDFSKAKKFGKVIFWQKNVLTSAVMSALKKGDTVTLVWFGTFSSSQRVASNGRNPQTGETIKIKARKVPKFKSGKDFKEKIAKYSFMDFDISSLSPFAQKILKLLSEKATCINDFQAIHKNQFDGETLEHFFIVLKN